MARHGDGIYQRSATWWLRRQLEGLDGGSGVMDGRYGVTRVWGFVLSGGDSI